MSKKAFFYIDDVIWVFRDLTRQRPASIFEHHFLKSLKETHDKTGLKVQMNLFYRTDYFYGNDEFSLADMTDAYKAEFEANSDWLKFAFHAKEEFPDYPSINADYEDIKDLFLMMEREVIRFAGEGSWAKKALCTHWLPLSKDACKALKDCGAEMVCATVGEAEEYNGDINSLPYGHAARLLQNRKPETKVFFRKSRDVAISYSACGWNHLSEEQWEATRTTLAAIKDEDTGLLFKGYCNTGTINLCEDFEQVKEDILPALDNEYLGFLIHEQYYYPDYYAYQPNAAAKIDLAATLIADAGFTFVNGEDLIV